MDDDTGTFAVLEERRFNARLSLLLALVGATFATVLIAVDAKTPVFSGKGAEMGPILILICTAIPVLAVVLLVPRMTRGLTPGGRVGAYLVVGVLEFLVLGAAWRVFG